MFEAEKEKLERQISEKTNRLKEIKEEQQEIEDREELINKYESTKKLLKHSKTLIIIYFIMCSLLIFSASAAYVSSIIGLVKVLILSVIAGGILSALASFPKFINYFQAKKVIKENQTQYEKAKENEEKDKELKLTLLEEYIRIDKELVPLNEMLNWFKKTEEMKKLGYIVEQVEIEAPNQIIEADHKEDLSTIEIDTDQKLGIPFLD